MKNILFLLGMVGILSLSSCGITNKDDYMKSFDSFVTEVEKKKEITEREYKRMSAQYEEYARNYYDKYKSQLSAQELSNVAKMKVRYVKALAQRHINDAGDAIDNITDDAEKAANDAKNTVNEAGKDAKKAAKKAGKEIKKAAKKAGDKAEEVFD